MLPHAGLPTVAPMFAAARGLSAVLILSAAVLSACGARATEASLEMPVQETGLGDAQHNVVASDGRDPYASARDPGTGEFIRDIATGEPLWTWPAPRLGPEQHNVVASDGRDPYASARDPGTGEFVLDIATGEPLWPTSAVERQLGPEQHLVVSSDGRDPYLSARDPATGEFVRDIGTGELLRR
jgi:hypothetical protein